MEKNQLSTSSLRDLAGVRGFSGMLQLSIKGVNQSPSGHMLFCIAEVYSKGRCNVVVQVFKEGF